MMVLTIDSLSKTFRRPLTRQSFAKSFSKPHRNRMKINAFENCSFSLEEKEMAFLAAPNGTGKTTLLKILSGIYTPTSGSFKVTGNVMPLFFGGPTMYSELEVHKNIAHFLRIYGFDKQRAADHSVEILEKLRLTAKKDYFLFQLSKGQLAAITLMAGISVPASLYLIDELLDPLDTNYRDIFLAELKATLTKNNAAALITTHQEELASLGRKIILT